MSNFHLNVRIDVDCQAGIQKFMERHSYTQSQAVRTLLAVAMRDGASSEERAAFKAAHREGYRRALNYIQHHLGDTVHKIFKGVEDNPDGEKNGGE